MSFLGQWQPQKFSQWKGNIGKNRCVVHRFRHSLGRLETSSINFFPFIGLIDNKIQGSRWNSDFERTYLIQTVITIGHVSLSTLRLCYFRVRGLKCFHAARRALIKFSRRDEQESGSARSRKNSFAKRASRRKCHSCSRRTLWMTLSAAEGRHGRRDNVASVSEGAECKRQRIIHPLPGSLVPLALVSRPSHPLVVSLSRKMCCTCHRGDVAAHRLVSITACASRIIVLKYNQSAQFAVLPEF